MRTPWVSPPRPAAGRGRRPSRCLLPGRSSRWVGFAASVPSWSFQAGGFLPRRCQRVALFFTVDVSRKSGYGLIMILSFRDKRTQDFAEGERVRAFSGFERAAHKRLLLLNLAKNLQALRALPGNRLEALVGNRKGQFSIRINQQWRICFEWSDGELGPSNVEIVDYH